MTLKALHDRLLAEKPDGAVHDTASCPLCSATDAELVDTPKGGSVSKTYTEEEFDAAVKAATDSLSQRVSELEAAAQSSEVDAAISAATTELDAKIVELHAQLDAKVIEAEAEKLRADAFVAWLDGEKVLADERDAVAARKGERLTKANEVASFPDGYLDDNADRIAAMSDEAFDVAIESWKAISAKGGKEAVGDKIPAGTALHAAEDTTTGSQESALKEIISLRRTGRVNLTSL